MAVALITGASSGIGRAAALLFARNSYKLALTGRNEAALSEVAKECISNGISANDVVTCAIDLSDNEAPSKITETTIAKFGRLDVLVNSAGILKGGSVLDAEIDVYDQLFDVNVRSLVRLTRASLPHIIKNKGTIVNVSSINGPCPFPGVTYYCMSKSAVDQFTKCLALEMAPHGVRVNAVNPGVTVTNLHRRAGQDETAYSAVVVEGASSGIGREAALKLAAEGYAISITGRNEEALNEVVKASGLDADKVVITVGDLSEDAAIKQLVANTLNKFGQVDTLINSAGILTNGPVIDTGIDVYDKQMEVNVRNVVKVTRAFLPNIIKTKGTIVNVSSITGPCPFPGVTYYCMSKAALDQFTKCLALEMAPHGVRVNAVNPGVIVTNVHLRSGMSEEAYAAFLKKGSETHALGRVGETKEVAEAIFFLASSKSSFTTGQLLKVDGGRGIMHPR